MKVLRSFPALGASLILATFVTPIQARVWTEAASGKTIDGEMTGLQGENVLIKIRSGKVYSIPLSRLSAEDQAFAKSGGSGASDGAPGDWAQFRGPKQDEHSPDTGLLKEWPAGGPKKLWTYGKAGLGYSGHIIVGGKLYTFGTEGTTLRAVCVNVADGSEVWSKDIGTDPGAGYNTGWGNGPRGAPTYSEGRLYALAPQGDLICVDAEKGDTVWTKNLPSEFKGQAGGWGYAESPLVDGKKVIVAPGGNESGIVALDKITGDVIWKSPVKAGKAEYATILNVENGGKRQYIRLFEKFIVGVDAETGAELWQSPWGGKTAVIPTPIFADGELFVSSGYGVGCKLVDLKGSSPKDVWENKELKNHHGGVVRVGDHLYGFDDGAGLVCLEWKTGKMVWNQKDRGLTKGSVHFADGKLYCLNEQDGTVTLVDATPDGFKSNGSFVLDPQSTRRNPQGKVWTHPVVIGGKLYLRDQEFISCYDVKG